MMVMRFFITRIVDVQGIRRRLEYFSPHREAQVNDDLRNVEIVEEVGAAVRGAPRFGVLDQGLDGFRNVGTHFVAHRQIRQIEEIYETVDQDPIGLHVHRLDRDLNCAQKVGDRGKKKPDKRNSYFVIYAAYISCCTH